jgi:hypothetical protein
MSSFLNMKTLLHGWKKEWTGFAVAVIGLRLLYAGIGWWVVSSGGPIPLNETIYGVIKPFLRADPFSRYFVNPWFEWDTISYLGIAIRGYRQDASLSFIDPIHSARLWRELSAGGIGAFNCILRNDINLDV